VDLPSPYFMTNEFWSILIENSGFDRAFLYLPKHQRTFCFP